MKKKGKKPTYKAETEEGEIFREQLEEVIKVQLEENDPPETHGGFFHSS